MKLAREIYRKVINLPPEGQKKVLNFVKELNQELENKKIDDAVERFIRKHKNALIELAKR
ncbi:hypothetical protein Calkr_2117 [Caldicellulosiruptor acetigenus I77R1B]|uniref:DUF2281 domain-containing protein n=1 Tax=Caldicellulosiruptor acetigenus (strain ATCC 700853 / DSM 12137 / I77R1B) TaxID=632335 RepID=E4S5S3_CALA7|nr:hypothetical protein [Caldicellulosiruptor acetigenus]ADQ41583.1 hypothetical protein Calkr_2117 [Caldicellulosiruptor acetigenus I77R1B]